MSESQLPVLSAPAAAPMPYAAPAPMAASAGGEDESSSGSQVARLLAAVKRYQWLVYTLPIVGLGAGYLASRFVEPEYAVQSALLLTTPQGGGNGAASRGPIREEQVLDPQGWMDLVRSFQIADSVVARLALYVEPSRSADSVLFRNFGINYRAQRFVPGEYTLKVTGPRYTLTDKVGAVREAGIVGDSVGREAGFAWQPPRAALGTDRTVEFKVVQPREASVRTLQRLQVGLARGSNIIVLQLTGTAQQKPAETLNAWGEQFTRIATELKTARVNQFTRTLVQQRADAEQRLAAAERAYQSFRVSTIALPSEALAIQPGAGGAAVVRADPVMDNYFASKYQLESLRRDREALERAAAQITPTSTPTTALLSVPLVASDPAATELRNALGEQLALDTELRTLRQTYRDTMPQIQTRLRRLAVLQEQVIPQTTRTLLEQFRTRERQLGGVVGRSTGELQAIPTRTAQQEALRRELDGATALFRSLDERYSEALLAEKSMAPDVRVLDTAVMPLEPTSRTTPFFLAGGLAAGLALGLGLAILLDRLDRRFRYPQQATGELGLQVLGAVPRIDQSRRQTPEQAAMMLEAFRTLRMNVRYACAPTTGKVVLTVTSPGSGDGKSLVSANLALSLAEGGLRTVLIDGDLRRGQLHTTFGVDGDRGLTEYLEGTSLLAEALQTTHHDNLSLITAGTRHLRAPELLATPRMSQLVAALAADFDAIIVDSPPLGAGTDAYALGAATRNMAVVLRTAATDLGMAKAKLLVLDQLPVQVVGAVLNDVRPDDGMFQYLAYDPEYAMLDEPEVRDDERVAIGAGSSR